MAGQAASRQEGVLYAGCGWLTYIGPAPILRSHQHPAIGVYVSLGQGLQLEGGAVVPALYVPPETRVPELDPGGGGGAAIFLAADNPCYPALLQRQGLSPRVLDGAIAPLVGVLQEAWQALPPGDRFVRRLLDVLDAGPYPAPANGQRDLLSLVAEKGEDVPSLSELAEAMALSPRRVQSLFQAQTRLRYRRYLLWRRLQEAADRIPQYRTLTDIALAAGFADLAHFSRTFSKLLGLSPAEWARLAAPLRFRRIHRAG